RKRTETASRLALGISEQLASLGMGGAQVRVEVARHAGEGDLMVKGARLTAEGVDRVEFLIAPNKGIEPRPLRKIASGGELSRALLAIKRVLASQGPAGLYIFDEVDAGVGGAVAERIGQALADIAKHHQVLCITHLAPIAALADYHFVVRKSQDGHVARTQVVPVTGEDRVREIARMLSGKNVTKASMQAATEMMQQRQR
ncbi:MAG TPA: DNA repair protein RecN, partial [Polyangiaceae bacterium]|nr:DNA repair protein RecN [Polyangiaceae bacterium]